MSLLAFCTWIVLCYEATAVAAIIAFGGHL